MWPSIRFLFQEENKPMVASVAMSDLSRQKCYRTQLGTDGLTRRHTVGQAVEHYLDRVGIRRDNGLRWTAFSRGLKLDSKQVLEDIPAESELTMTVMPEVSAG
jgi:hypothetical protein